MAFIPARRQVHAQQLASAIARFYEAAVRPELWREALHTFSEAAGAEGSLLLFHGSERQRRFACSEGLDASMPDYLAGDWHIHNEVIRRGVVKAQAGALVQTEWTLFDGDDYRRDLFFNDFLRPHGFGWFAGFFVGQPANGLISLSPQRRLRDDPFTSDETAIVATIVPHVRRAAELAMAWSDARASGSLDTLSLLNVPAFLLDRDGCVRNHNAGADALLGRGLDLVGRRLTVRHAPAVAAALQVLTRRLTGNQQEADAEPLGPVRVPRPSKGTLLLSGVPLTGTARDVFQEATALLTVVDLDRHRFRPEPLIARAFGLTQAEAATAVALADGLDFAEVAARRGIGLETVRSQAKSIGVKTGARKRGALVALLHRVLAATPDQP